MPTHASYNAYDADGIDCAGALRGDRAAGTASRGADVGRVLHDRARGSSDRPCERSRARARDSAADLCPPPARTSPLTLPSPFAASKSWRSRVDQEDAGAVARVRHPRSWRTRRRADEPGEDPQTDAGHARDEGGVRGEERE